MIIFYPRSGKKEDDKITSAKFQKHQFKMYFVENSKTRRQTLIDPDEIAHYELSHVDLQSLQIQLYLCLELLGFIGLILRGQLFKVSLA